MAKVVAEHSKEHKGGPTSGSVLRVPSARVDRGPAGIKTPVAPPRSPSTNNTNADGMLKVSGSKQAPPHPSTLEIKLELTNETTGASTPLSGHRRSIARAGSRASLSTNPAIGSADSPMHATVQVEGDKGHSAVEDLDDDEDTELAAAIAAYTTESGRTRRSPTLRSGVRLSAALSTCCFRNSALYSSGCLVCASGKVAGRAMGQ